MRISRKGLLLVGLAALLMLAVVSTASASNMAFKINMSVQGQPACNTCDNWISLPFNNPFIGKRLRDFCDTDGDGVGGTGSGTDPGDQIALVAQENPANVDAEPFHSCLGSAALPNPLYVPTRAVRLRPRTGLGTIQIVYVGSDVPGTKIELQEAGGACNTCDNWVDLVYHTTYARLRDVCDTNGNGIGGTGSSTDAGDAIALVAQESAANVDAEPFHSCLGSPALPNPTIQIGRGLRVRLRTGVTAPCPSGAANCFPLSEPHF